MPPRPARAKTYAVTSGDPWLAQLLDGSWTLTAYTVPGLDRGAALVIPGQDDTTGDLSIVPLGGDRHLISTGGELAVWDLRLGRRVVGPVRLWATDEQRRRFSSRTHVVRRPGHPDQFIAYTAGERVQLWTLGDGPPEMTPLDLTADGGDIVFDARGERLMHLTPGKLIETWHLERGERTGTPFTAAGYDHLVGATTDGYLVTTVETMSNMRELGLWDPVSRSLSGTLRLSWSEMAQDLGTVTVTGSEVELEGRGLMPSTLSVDATVWAATLCRALTGGFTEAERNRLPEGVEDADPCP